MNTTTSADLDFAATIAVNASRTAARRVAKLDALIAAAMLLGDSTEDDDLTYADCAAVSRSYNPTAHTELLKQRRLAGDELERLEEIERVALLALDAPDEAA